MLEIRVEIAYVIREPGWKLHARGGRFAQVSLSSGVAHSAYPYPKIPACKEVMPKSKHFQ